MLQNYPKPFSAFKILSAAFDIGIIICSQQNNHFTHILFGGELSLRQNIMRLLKISQFLHFPTPYQLTFY